MSDDEQAQSRREAILAENAEEEAEAAEIEVAENGPVPVAERRRCVVEPGDGRSPEDQANSV